ncbi:MAG: Zinc-binding dehydrogenase, partial [Deltaproteobacteria bacterium]|nr:Zinc-binding dehydrogenase [Deltaproteobacteria bacterium]
PVIYRSYPLERAAEALAALGSRKTHGKVVLAP